MTCETFALDFAIGMSFVVVAGALSYFYFKKTFLALLTAQLLSAALVIIFLPQVM